MKRVTGIGGIFFKSKDPAQLRDWYRKHLGIEAETWGAQLHWRDDPRNSEAYTVWSPFANDTKHFDPSHASFMINYRVDDLDWLLTQLRAEGVEVDPKVEESEYGKFAWIMDPEGNRVELFEPPAPAK